MRDDPPADPKGAGALGACTVIIVNWNTRDLVLRCLAVLQAATGGRLGGVVVVDNGSVDGSAAAIAAAHPAVLVLRQPENLGFAAAVNLALARCQTPCVALLNSDAEVQPGALEALLAYLERHPRVAVAGARLVNPDGSPQNAFGPAPTLLTELVNKSLLAHLWPSRWGRKSRAGETPRAVDAVIGACCLVRRDAIRAVGGLDDGYVMFLEETDWCVRMRRAGWGVVHVPDAVVVHRQGASARLAGAAARIEYHRSLYRFFGVHRHPLARRSLPFVKGAGSGIRAVAAGLQWGLSFGRARRAGRDAMTAAQVWWWHVCGCPPSPGLRPPRLADRWGPAGPRRILVIKLSAMGDVIQSLPFLQGLRARFPQATLVWAVDAQCADLVRDHPSLDEVVVLQRDWGHLGRVGGWCQAAWAIGGGRFDLAIDLQGLLRSAVLVGLSRAPVRLGFANGREGSPWFYTHTVVVPGIPFHAVDRYVVMLRTLTPQGAGPDQGPGEAGEPGTAVLVGGVPITADDRARAQALLATARWDGDGPLIAINPSARWPSKRWPVDRFGRLCEALVHGLGARVIVVGASGDRAITRQVLAGCRASVLDATGRTSVRELGAVFEAAAVVVTNDSGPMHLAVAVGTPVVALFGSTDPRRTGPYGSRHRVIQRAVPCVPCLSRMCWQPRHYCMELIAVEDVVEQVRDVVQGCEGQRGARAGGGASSPARAALPP